MNDIANYILQVVLGPIKGLEYLNAAYNAPYLVQLINAISYSDSYLVPVEINTDVIEKGMEELKRIMDMAVDTYKNISDEQKLLCKSGNTWFVGTCHKYIMSRCKVVNK